MSPLPGQFNYIKGSMLIAIFNPDKIKYFLEVVNFIHEVFLNSILFFYDDIFTISKHSKNHNEKENNNVYFKTMSPM